MTEEYTTLLYTYVTGDTLEACFDQLPEVCSIVSAFYAKDMFYLVYATEDYTAIDTMQVIQSA